MPDRPAGHGIREDYWVAVDRCQSGKSKPYVALKDPADRRRVLIQYDSIPERTRQRYDLPGEDYLRGQHATNRLASRAEDELDFYLHYVLTEGYAPAAGGLRVRDREIEGCTLRAYARAVAEE